MSVIFPVPRAVVVQFDCLNQTHERHIGFQPPLRDILWDPGFEDEKLRDISKKIRHPLD